MIQEIGTHIYHNQYRPREPRAQDYALIYDGASILMKLDGNRIELPTLGAVDALRATYYFAVDDRAFFGTATPQILPQGYAFYPLRLLRAAQPRWLAFAGVTGWQLSQWYDRNRYCGRCGALTRRDESERMLRCDTCGNAAYPQIAPAVIVGIYAEDRLLLTKYAGREYTDYALVAGFCEIGETVEQTIAREVMEEVGLRVKKPTYWGSQPWSLGGSLLMGFFCEADGSTDITLDPNELSCAQWVTRQDLPDDEEDCSLTMRMIADFKRGEAPRR